MRIAKVKPTDAIMDLISEIDITCDACTKEILTTNPTGWIWLYEGLLVQDDDPAILLCPTCKKDIPKQ